MIITCPACDSQYRIDPSGTSKRVAKIKCPACAHLFEVAFKESVPAVEDPSGAVTSSAGPAVLIVDDARFFREMITDILSELPVCLDTAEDGNEAWDRIEQSPPDLLLLDLNIPGKNGYELLKALQSRPVQGQMKILVMSGVERGDQVTDEVRRLGADDFLSKSFTPQELQSRVRQLLGL